MANAGETGRRATAKIEKGAIKPLFYVVLAVGSKPFHEAQRVIKLVFMDYSKQLEEILERAKAAAVDYYKLTKKPLGITGEVGEYWAAHLLGLKLADARTPGYDAIEPATGCRIQIKSRLVPNSNKLGGQRMGVINLQNDWDTVMLVIMRDAFEPVGIYEAERSKIKELLVKTDSKSRQQGALAVTEFISNAKPLWPK